MPKISASDYADKWSRRTKGASEDLRKGIESTTTTPSTEAIKNKEKMKQNLVESIDNGSWEAGLKNYTLEDWKNDMKTKGIPRIAVGVDSAKGDMQDFATQLIAYEASVESQIANMPSMTLEDNIARSVAWQRAMAQFKRK